MEDELKARRNKRKLEEMKEESNNEFAKETEVEEVKKELVEEQKNEELKEKNNSNKKRSVGRIISRIIWAIIIIVVLFETVIGILDMQRLNDDKEPIWYISTKTEKTKNGSETTYNLGLYVIVKTIEGKETKTTLKPFFLK